MGRRLSDREMMLLAIASARTGIAAGQAPFGAAIARAGKLIASGYNEVWKACDITAHAEIIALRAACQCIHGISLAGATVYSTTEPCPMCFSACHWAGVERIVSGATIADAARAGFRELTISNRRMRSLGGAKMEIVPRFMRDECLALFEEFARANGRGRVY